MKVPSKPITEKQLASIHIAYRFWAKELNDAGYSINKAIEQGLLTMDIPFTEQNTKQIFGYLAIEHLFPDKFDPAGPKHPKLSTTQEQLLFETLNANFASKFGISIPFPCKEQNDE